MWLAGCGLRSRYGLSRFVTLLLLAAGLSAWAQQNRPAAAAAGTPQPGATAPQSKPAIPGAAKPSGTTESDSSTLRLGPGDLVEVSVYGVPELSTKARVSNAGDLYLPLIDYVHVADLTLEEAQTIIQKRLESGGFVRNPHVSLFIDEYASQSVTLLGEVARPGVYPVLGDRRLYDVVSAAGGFSDKAGKIVNITHRSQPDHPTTIHLASDLLQSSESNVLLQPGDTVVVARAGVVYVVGDVGRPSGFMIDDNNLTVLKALALAGGTNKTAAPNASKLLRQTPQGVREIPVPLKKILHAQAPDEPMLKGDILFVPGSSAKAFAYRGAEAVMSMTTALTIIAVQ